MEKEHQSDRHLVKSVLEGNTSSFKHIISNTQALVMQIIFKMIGNQQDREDLIQEVYLKVFNKLSGFKFNSKLSTWIGTIAYNTSINYLQKNSIQTIDVHDDDYDNLVASIRDGSLNIGENSIALQILQSERGEMLQKEIGKLSPIYRTIISLYHMEELSYKEISEITQLPEGTLKSYLFRARKKLRENILINYKKEDL